MNYGYEIPTYDILEFAVSLNFFISIVQRFRNIEVNFLSAFIGLNSILEPIYLLISLVSFIL